MSRIRCRLVVSLLWWTAALVPAAAAESGTATRAVVPVVQTLAAAPAAGSDLPVTIQVDAGDRVGPITPIWRFFGADEPNYTTSASGEKLLGELGSLSPPPVYFRTHNLLTSGNGTPALKWGSTNVYTEDAAGNAVYSWTILDSILDACLTRGVRPYFQLGFMPEALSTHPQPYQHSWRPGAPYDQVFTGWAYPPRDFARWGELVYQLTRHCVEKYGRKETEGWYWEVWNEPNIGYWRGTREEFFKLYDFAAAGVRRALPTAKIGGPETAGGPGGTWLHDFLAHCSHGVNAVTGKLGAPLDFISFHAKGAPRFVDGHVEMGIANQLRDIDAACAVIAGFPKYRQTPVFIGESDPDGCAACQGAQLGYRDSTLYASYTAASFARKSDIAARHGVRLEGAITWAFTFPDQPYFAGFRQLATNGIDLPVLNAFRMFHQLSGDRLRVTSSADAGLDTMLRSGVRLAPDVSAIASLDRNKRRLSILVWHYHDDDMPGPAAAVNLAIHGLPARGRVLTLSHYRVDATHSNAFTAWQQLGSPAAPTPAQYTRLAAAGQLTALAAPVQVQHGSGSFEVHFSLPRQALSLLVFEWK